MSNPYPLQPPPPPSPNHSLSPHPPPPSTAIWPNIIQGIGPKYPKSSVAAMAESVRSGASTSKLSSSSAGSGRGPVEVDGVVFLRSKTCPLSGLKNTDLNPMLQGPLGRSFSKFAVWHRGSSQNPQSRFERVSVMTWEHGGFADRFPNMDQFAEKLQAENACRPSSKLLMPK